MIEAIGWTSSIILLLTIGRQIWKQWREGSSEGVSKYLFMGQTTAAAGFTTYSWMVGNRVFVVTNALILLSALVGLGITLFQKRQQTNGRPSASD